MNAHEKKTCGVQSQTSDVEAVLVNKLTLSKSNGDKLSNKLIQTKALSIHQRLGNDSGCQYKQGWIWRFKQRCLKGSHGSKGVVLFQ